MIDRLLFALTFVTALASGLVGGVFFAFSTFVMGALGRIPPASGISAMQSINVVVLNSWFLTVFMATAGACVVLGIAAILNWREPGAACLLAGSLVYLLGSLLVTGALNVPLNNELATADPTSAASARLWARYLTSWTFWNHVRTAACVAAAAFFTVVLIQKS